MKKLRSKLALNRETIANLTDGRLNEAAGGGKPLSGGTVCNSVCPTLCNCPSQNNTQCNTGCLPCGTQTGCIETYTC